MIDSEQILLEFPFFKKVSRDSMMVLTRVNFFGARYVFKQRWVFEQREQLHNQQQLQQQRPSSQLQPFPKKKGGVEWSKHYFVARMDVNVRFIPLGEENLHRGEEYLKPQMGKNPPSSFSPSNHP